MSAEGKPPAEPSLLSRPLAQLAARLVTAYPLVTVVLGVVAAVASLLVAQKQLKFQTNRADVLNPNSEYNRRWLRYTAEFGDEEDVVVVVEGRNAQTLRPVLDEIGLAIAREDRTFHAEMHRVDLSRIRSKGLYYLPTAELTAIDGFLVQLDGVLQGDWSQLSLGKMAADLGRPSSSGAHGRSRRARGSATEPDPLPGRLYGRPGRSQHLSIAVAGNVALGRGPRPVRSPLPAGQRRPLGLRAPAIHRERRGELRPEQRRHRSAAEDHRAHQDPLPRRHDRAHRTAGHGKRRDAAEPGVDVVGDLSLAGLGVSGAVGRLRLSAALAHGHGGAAAGYHLDRWLYSDHRRLLEYFEHRLRLDPHGIGD